ncbi:MAG: hypothetical protein GWP36_10065 [Bacteroidetes bacterium]|jgi:hypothetical protein|nr:hypothetical protein [Bacteroidota bacterium]
MQHDIAGPRIISIARVNTIAVGDVNKCRPWIDYDLLAGKDWPAIKD